MKFEHTVIMTVELTKILHEDNADDLSEKFANGLKQWLYREALLDNVNVVGCQDFIREVEQVTNQDGWISFDPEDRLTWPARDTYAENPTTVPVLTCNKENVIHIGCIAGLNETKDNPLRWELSNIVEDLSAKLDEIVAWQPLPAPYTKEGETK